MSLNDDERRIIVGLEYEKAVNTFSQIQELQKLGYWDNIANRLYSDLQTMRNNSDYNCSYAATQKEIEPLIEPARLLIEKIEKYVV